MRWNLRAADSTRVALLAAALPDDSALPVHDPQMVLTLARLLVARGIVDSEAAARFNQQAVRHRRCPGAGHHPLDRIDDGVGRLGRDDRADNRTLAPPLIVREDTELVLRIRLPRESQVHAALERRRQ